MGALQVVSGEITVAGARGLIEARLLWRRIEIVAADPAYIVDVESGRQTGIEVEQSVFVELLLTDCVGTL